MIRVAFAAPFLHRMADHWFPAVAPVSWDSFPVAFAAVVFTALEDGSWIGFYDASGKMLMGRQMMKGESYTVPADAEGPVVETGRPYAFDITIGGKPVPKLSEEAIVVSDVPVSAAALLARGSETPKSGETGETAEN